MQETRGAGGDDVVDDFFSLVFHYRSVYSESQKSTRDFIWIFQISSLADDAEAYG